MPSVIAQTYFVIPLSVQKEGEDYVVGNADLGDFYQFPEQGLNILRMLESGAAPAAIKARLEAEGSERVDVDAFVELLSSIGFIHPEARRSEVQDRLNASKNDRRRVFDVDPRVAGAVFSRPAMFGYACLVGFAIYEMIREPALRISFQAFYTETNRTALLLLTLAFSLVQVTLHESSHMLAAAKYGVKSRYGLSNRLWAIVAESDVTGILTLPKSQRYLPILAGMLADTLCIAALTALLAIMLRAGVQGYSFRLVQAFVLEIFVAIVWQFNIFVKTDVYFLISNYFSYYDIDTEARQYLAALAHKLSLGLVGSAPAQPAARVRPALRLFAAIWLLGRVLSLALLFGVFLPTMAQYLFSAFQILSDGAASFWVACDTIAYVALSFGMVGIGLYMWISKKTSRQTLEENYEHA